MSAEAQGRALELKALGAVVAAARREVAALRASATATGTTGASGGGGGGKAKWNKQAKDGRQAATAGRQASGIKAPMIGGGEDGDTSGGGDDGDENAPEWRRRKLLGAPASDSGDGGLGSHLGACEGLPPLPALAAFYAKRDADLRTQLVRRQQAQVQT